MCGLQARRATWASAASHYCILLQAAAGTAVPNVRIIGATCNLGIGRAMLTLVQQTKTRLFMFLEDDWVLPFHRSVWLPLFKGARRYNKALIEP